MLHEDQRTSLAAPLGISSQLLPSSNLFPNFLYVPIYVYETLRADGQPGERFEIQQSMRDAALTCHPESGEPVRRVLQAPNLSTRYTPRATASKLDNKNVAEKGFTKYERDKLTGRYHKVAGKQGPSTLDPGAGA